jgi:hypothetical protein
MLRKARRMKVFLGNMGFQQIGYPIKLKNMNRSQKNDDGEKTPTEDPDEMNEFELWSKLMNTVKDMTVEELYDNFDGDRVVKMTVAETDADVDVQAHTGFYDVISRLVKGNDISISTSDNGADTCVVGTGWTILIKTTRKANLRPVLIPTMQGRKASLL